MALNTRRRGSAVVPKVLYGISPIGLGHATRSLVIVEELKRRGADVRVFSGGKAAVFLREQGVPVDEAVDEAGPTVRGLEMSRVSTWYIRAWLAQRTNLKRADALIGAYAPDVVVCDEEFSGVTAAERKGVRRVFIADELALGFARGWLSRRIERRVERWYERLLRSVDLLVIPEAGVDSGNRVFVGPIVRPVTMTGEEAKAEHGVPAGRFVLVSLSGSGIGRELAERVVSAAEEAGLGDVNIVVTGNRGEKLGSGAYDLGVVGDNQNLVACAELVISTAGKSTIDEAARSGTPIIVIPIRHHAEQARNAQALGYRFEDLDSLPRLIKERLGGRERGVPADGHVRAADAIISLAGSLRTSGTTVT
jgi:UDP-N-acetylglucosamine--N-acetylmuramyl-(pentapeptide) pyrophosphoryl-undecaprenol N-acetylglucosamine transferase